MSVPLRLRRAVDPDVTYYVPVSGTGAWDAEPSIDEWWHPRSKFSIFLESYGLVQLDPVEPFVFDGRIDGLRWPWDRHKKHVVWSAGGANLRRYFKGVPLEHINLIGHSHAGNLIFYAAQAMRINRLLTVTTPVRKDMRLLAEQTAKNIASGWRHLHATDWSDRTQILGGLMDGAVSFERRFLIPGVTNIGVPKLGHSDALNKPELFPLWQREGLIPFLKGELERL